MPESPDASEDRAPQSLSARFRDAIRLREDKTVPPKSKTNNATSPGFRSARSAAPSASGSAIGNYDLIEEIARGGMGVVYKAHQKKLNRIVAVKTMMGGRFASQEERERFLVEAAAAALLRHPNIVPVYEVDECDDQLFFSMAWVDGNSLADRIASGPVAARQAAAIMETSARAIQYAHEKQVIHRDIKPANILLDEQDGPHITDFGIAKILDQTQSNTATGEFMGTADYIPPEQATGDVEQIGPQSDVYSLGATLYALLTGRPPFQAATLADTIVQLLNRDPLPVRRLNPAVPVDLETICQKCLEKQPARRYASAEELADELRRFLNHEPIHARPVGKLAQLAKWSKRNPVQSLLAATIVISLLALVAITWMYNRRLVAERQDALMAEKQSRRSLELARDVIERFATQKNSSTALLALRSCGELAHGLHELRNQAGDSRGQYERIKYQHMRLRSLNIPELQQSLVSMRDCFSSDDSRENIELLRKRAPDFIAAMRVAWHESMKRYPELKHQIQQLTTTDAINALREIELAPEFSEAEPYIQSLQQLSYGDAKIVSKSLFDELDRTCRSMSLWKRGMMPPEIKAVVIATRELIGKSRYNR